MDTHDQTNEKLTLAMVHSIAFKSNSAFETNNSKY